MNATTAKTFIAVWSVIIGLSIFFSDSDSNKILLAILLTFIILVYGVLQIADIQDRLSKIEENSKK
jgi:multisubunit Na+/H+ antiporter MnhG subunit